VTGFKSKSPREDLHRKSKHNYKNAFNASHTLVSTHHQSLSICL